MQYPIIWITCIYNAISNNLVNNITKANHIKATTTSAKAMKKYLI